MSQRRYIQVLLPLRLEWEPFYYYEGTEDLKTGDRVRVDFAGNEYVAAVTTPDAEEGADKVGMSRIKPINGRAEGLAPVSFEEIALWRKVAEYYMCTVGEVFKAAYPVQKVAEEEIKARMDASMTDRLEKKRIKEEGKRAKLRERVLRKEDQLSKARSEATRQRYRLELDSLRASLASLSCPGNTRIAASESKTEIFSGQISSRNPITLSEAQEEAFSQIKGIFNRNKPALLHGVTGSGKTEIYLRLAQETLSQGKNVLYLVPEIALSRQLEERIGSIFPEELQVFHSGETAVHKREVASSIRSGRYIVLGTRSAIFLPHKELGLVIIDEEQDSSYKQDNPAPRYNGRETAIMIAGIFGARVILGSATPSLESLYNCGAGRYGLVRLRKRFYDAEDSDVEIIDTIAERRKNGMVGDFSRKLIDRISERLSLKEQVIVLRERRAFSPMVQCQECGYVPKCCRCNVSLSLHKRPDGTERLVCHYCGMVLEYTGICPECGGGLKPLGSGTQKIEEEIGRLFPGARIARLDSDTAQRRKDETEIIRRFEKGGIDILVGTRIVAKGFDFSGLTLVAVIQADSILGQDTYRADELGLQLLEQFRGRSGRRGEKGLFVIQTSQPEHPVFQSLEGRLDERDAADRLLAERKLFGYPPYSRVIGVIIKDRSLPRVELMSRELAGTMRASGMSSSSKVIGPYSPSVDKVSNQHIRRIRILLPKDRNLSSNKTALAKAVGKFEKDRKYQGHISLDVDPV